MEALLTSFGMVTLAEMGDKTQLLSFLLAARFNRQYLAIILGILVATLANHAVAAMVGEWIAAQISPTAMRWVLGFVFLGFAVWALVPDRLDETEGRRGNYGAFLTTLVIFFIAEIGDKTQLATIGLGARFDALAQVVLGTTLGMMAANVPAVLLGERLVQYVSMRLMRQIAAALFGLFGLLILLGVSDRLPFL